MAVVYDSRVRSFAVLATLLVAAVAPAPVSASRSEPALAKKHKTRSVAAVRVEIRQENGDIIKSASTILEWDEEGTVSIEVDETIHDVDVLLDRKGARADMTLAYTRAGEKIIAPFQLDIKLWKREVIRSDGGLAIAVTVTPKRIEVEAERPKRPRIDDDGGDDPLDGVN